MPIKEMKFELPEWTEKDFSLLKKSHQAMRDLAGSSGKSSNLFNEVCLRFKKLSQKGRGAITSNEIKRAIDVRALTYLWATSDTFYENTPVSLDLLNSLRKPRPKLGSLTLLQLIRVFFMRFDLIGDKKVFQELANLIIQEVPRGMKSGSNDNDLARLASHRLMLFQEEGPSKVVNYAYKAKIDLDQIFNKFGLNGYNDGRFQNICRYTYFLDTLKRLPVGLDDPVLSEVCKYEVYTAPAKGGCLLGHEILSILIDRTGHQKVSDAWRNVVLTIAGDPRVPYSSKKYQQWWALLGDERVSTVRGWLSEFDLRLFLRVLEEYGHSSGNQSLQRMFPARRAFLNGLLEQGLISNSRLFVCGHAENYLKANFRQQELPEYARMKDASRSMIYLEVGGLFIVEGSHNFKMWIFPKMPQDAGLKRYGGGTFDPDDLSYSLKRKYLNEFGKLAPSVLAITHNPNITWQASAIAQLRHLGLRLDVEELFSPEDYRQYKARFGL